MPGAFPVEVLLARPRGPHGLCPGARAGARRTNAGGAAGGAKRIVPKLRRASIACCILASLATRAAGAQEAAPAVAPAVAPAAAGTAAEGDGTLTGDWGGAREGLARSGVRLGLSYVGEGLGNVSGGLRRGSAYLGRLTFTLNADLERAAGWTGARFHASALQIHGRGLTEPYLRNILTTSAIEGAPSTRLFTAWFEQDLFGGAVSVRAGKLAADEEFLASDQASTFANATFGWPAITAVNLPAGGPTYPLGAPGVRVRAELAEGLSVAVGVFNGHPVGAASADPQRRNRTGLRFPVGDDAFSIAEMAFAPEGGVFGRPATFKLGGWHHSGRSEAFRSGGAETGGAGSRRGNHGLYGIADGMLWRGGEPEGGGVGAFARIGVAPGDRSAIGLYVDGGLTYKGLIRSGDVIGLAFAHARVSDPLRRSDRSARLGDGDGPLRRSESLVELTYVAQLAPWWTAQPSVQFVLDPGADTRNRNAAVVGLRTTLVF